MNIIHHLSIATKVFRGKDIDTSSHDDNHSNGTQDYTVFDNSSRRRHDLYHTHYITRNTDVVVRNVVPTLSNLIVHGNNYLTS